ncbi:MAG TPA: YHS domain-containing (seleno)protein, partial [Pseudolabrys sp.]
MTPARQAWKSRQIVWLLLSLTLCGIYAPAAKAADEPTVVNSHSGLAISGFDPVAYFADRAPKAGRPDMELSQGGVVWRFRNEGNKSAFEGHPEIYAPRFGGFDPVAITRGVSVAGHPMVWSVVGERLYLFYNDEARTAFNADPGRFIAAATRKWPDVARTVGR